MVHVRGARAGASGIIPPSRAGMWCVRGSWVGCPFFFYRFWIVFYFNLLLSHLPFLLLNVCFWRSIKKQPSAHGRMHRWKKLVVSESSTINGGRERSRRCALVVVFIYVLLLLLKFLFFFSAFTDNGDSDGEKWWLLLLFFKISSCHLLRSYFRAPLFFWWFFLLCFLSAVCSFCRGTV